MLLTLWKVSNILRFLKAALSSPAAFQSYQHKNQCFKLQMTTWAKHQKWVKTVQSKLPLQSPIRRRKVDAMKVFFLQHFGIRHRPNRKDTKIWWPTQWQCRRRKFPFSTRVFRRHLLTIVQFMAIKYCRIFS